MKIVFRTDSSLTIGSGHLMRCITLGDELRRRGAEVSFICRDHFGNLIYLLEEKGFPVVPLNGETEGHRLDDTVHSSWLGVSWEADAAQTIAVLNKNKPDWLIVDHYAIDKLWEKKLRPYAEKIMVIDDLADRHHDCDLLLDQNMYYEMETRYDKLVPNACKKLVGPKYALLRPEFAIARKSLRQRDGQVKRVLVFFGGVDQFNETEKALNALVKMDNRQFDVDVVVGSANPNKLQIQIICATHAGFNYHCQIDYLARLMADADLAIGAGGVATWERCAVGLPSIVIAVANNQKELAKTGALHGLLFYLGEANNASSDRLLHVLKFCQYSYDTLRFYSDNCLSAVDGKGTKRVVNYLLYPPISIRRASIKDCDSVYDWRNNEETRQYIFNTEPIQLETHRKWYIETINNPNRVLLIGEIDNKPVGVLRYDINNDIALISVYLVPGGHRKGIGSHLICCGSRWVRDNYPHVRAINAEIFSDNIASLRAFESAGYKEHHLIFQEVLQ